MSRITLEFLQEIIHLSEPGVIVTNFQDTPGSGRGDNYTAMLYRIKLQGYQLNKKTKEKEHWEKSLIYKCLPDNFARREAFKSDSLFKNEVAFYTTVMPALLNYQKSKGLKDPFHAIPKCYFAKSDILVLEDLCIRGFRMGDRKQGLNYDQCLIVIDSLAKFHALSLAFKIEYPSEFQKLLHNENGIREIYFIKENEEWYRSYYTAVRHNALTMVQDGLAHNKQGEKYLNKFKEFVDDSFYFRMMSLVKPVEPLAVFCHGDCWTNNILFYTVDENKIHDVCFLDFQLCRYASPVLDLANLVFCCTTRQLRDQKLDQLLTEYFERLYACLRQLLNEESTISSPFLQKEQLQQAIDKEFKKCGLFGLGLALDMIPISTCDSEQAPDLYQNQAKTDSDQLEQFGVCPVWTSNESCKMKMVNLVCELVDREIL